MLNPNIYPLNSGLQLQLQFDSPVRDKSEKVQVWVETENGIIFVPCWRTLEQ